MTDTPETAGRPGISECNRRPAHRGQRRGQAKPPGRLGPTGVVSRAPGAPLVGLRSVLGSFSICYLLIIVSKSDATIGGAYKSYQKEELWDDTFPSVRLVFMNIKKKKKMLALEIGKMEIGEMIDAFR